MGLRRLRAHQLTPHPDNPRGHPEQQQTLIRSLLEQLGLVRAFVARKVPRTTAATGYQLLDGAARLPEVRPTQRVPVLLVDLTDDEARAFLLTHDELARLAEPDGARIAQLVQEVRDQAPRVQGLLDFLQRLTPPAPIAAAVPRAARDTGRTPAEELQRFLGAQTKQLTLYVPQRDYPTVMAALSLLMERRQTDDASTAVLGLLGEAYP